jgi:hypothetical protein
MAYQRLSLKQNGDYFALYSDSHKTDVLTAQFTAGSTFGTGKILETRTFLKLDGTIDLITDVAPYIDSSGVQIEYTFPGQVSRSVSNKSTVYIYTLQAADAATDIIVTIPDGVKFKTNVTHAII